MEMRETIEISGTPPGEATVLVGGGDDTIEISVGNAEDGAIDTTFNLAEARRLRDVLSLAIKVAEYNVTDFS